jgi:hypothetical protein
MMGASASASTTATTTNTTTATTRTITTTTTAPTFIGKACPQHILNYIETVSGRSVISVEECKSAQQQVWIVGLDGNGGGGVSSSCGINNDYQNGTTATATTTAATTSTTPVAAVVAEHDNTTGSLIPVPVPVPSISSTLFIQDEWNQALQRGRNKVVVRLWKAGARWWNLHQNQSSSNSKNDGNNNYENHAIHSSGSSMIVTLAKSEMTGYRLARHAFLLIGGKDGQSGDSHDHHSEKEGKDPATTATHGNPNDSDDDELAVSTVWWSGGGGSSSSSAYIPRVLHYQAGRIVQDHQDDDSYNDDDDDDDSCWAVLEYVGMDSALFFTTNDKYSDDKATASTATTSLYYYEYDSSFLLGMEIFRDEFGFREPHPRWGRVPTNQVMDYALMIVRQVLLPVHRATSQTLRQRHAAAAAAAATLSQSNVGDKVSGTTPTGGKRIDSNSTRPPPLPRPMPSWSQHNDGLPRPQRYQDMVDLYRRALDDRIQPVWTSRQQQQQPDDDKDTFDLEQSHKMQAMLEHLYRALEDMKTYTITTTATSTDTLAINTMNVHTPELIPPLDPVLVHMDLQPQNVLLAIRRICRTVPMPLEEDDAIHNSSNNNDDNNTMVVRSVLDWEDAAIADPRFDILMIGRKVCATREQADTIWNVYQQEYYHLSIAPCHGPIGGGDNSVGTTSAVGTTTNREFSLGPIEPWLQLETVHSMITLLLQSMDLLGGGRNPWETKHDLWGKLEREFHRLKEHSAIFPPLQH